MKKKKKKNIIRYHSVWDQYLVQFPTFPDIIPGPTYLLRTEQVSDIYAWQIAISHDPGLKEMG